MHSCNGRRAETSLAVNISVLTCSTLTLQPKYGCVEASQASCPGKFQPAAHLGGKHVARAVHEVVRLVHHEHAARAELLALPGEGETVVLSGRWVLFRFPVADTGMRRLAMVALTEAGHPVKTVATVFGVHPNYLSTLRKTAREQGSGGLVKAMGHSKKLGRFLRFQDFYGSLRGVGKEMIVESIGPQHHLMLTGALRFSFSKPLLECFPSEGRNVSLLRNTSD